MAGVDEKIIKTLRKWTLKTFAENKILSNKYISSLSDLGSFDEEKANDFDLQVKIL
jgi:hypothetical protein